MAGKLHCSSAHKIEKKIVVRKKGYKRFFKIAETKDDEERPFVDRDTRESHQKTASRSGEFELER